MAKPSLSMAFGIWMLLAGTPPALAQPSPSAPVLPKVPGMAPAPPRPPRASRAAVPSAPRQVTTERQVGRQGGLKDRLAQGRIRKDGLDEKYLKALEILQRYGVSTRPFEQVGRELNIVAWGWTTSDLYFTTLSSISFSDATVDDLNVENFDLVGTQPASAAGASGLGAFVHETMHAYLDLSPGLDAIWKRGVAYYRGAKLTTGGPVDDPERVFDEAVASYAGFRIAAFVRRQQEMEALGTIVARKAARNEPLDAQAFAAALERTRKRYERSMERRVFGYQEVGGRQVETTAPMPQWLKTWIDESILDSRIPDRI